VRAWNRSLRIAVAVLTAAVLSGCADASWQSVRRHDTVASYHKYLRDNPSSSHAPEAKERIAFLRVKAVPTVAAFEEFQAEHPRSDYLDELRSLVEPLYFENARWENTPEAYREFLNRYPEGDLSRRALGNLVYVEQVRSTPADRSICLPVAGSRRMPRPDSLNAASASPSSR